MKSLYPDNVINKILQITLETQTFAYLSIDNQGVLISQGGNIETLGLPTWSLQANILDDALFLSGFVPMTRDYEIIPSLNITDSQVVDIHLFHDNDLIWIILVDKTDDIEWQKQARQNSNELHLLKLELDTQKKTSSTQNYNESEFEFFEALNMMAFRFNESGEFDLLKPFSDEFYEVYPEASDPTNQLNPRHKFPFIENFLVDAQELWDQNINYKQVSSGPWVEKFKNGYDIALEAKAVSLNGHKLLFIQIMGPCYKQNQEFLQLGREGVLQRKKLEKEIQKQTMDIRYLATHDALTDLPNRYSLLKRLDEAVKSATRHKQKFALFFMDLDEFKGVNDSLGHDTGDELLKIIGGKLEQVLREIDFAARLGGDEFCILLEEITEAFDAAQVADRCLDMISEPVIIGGYKLQPRISIGITIFPDDGQNPEQLLSAADVAMYAAKHAGKHQYAFYTPELTLLAAERMSLENDLRHAIENGEFILEYQPQISIVTGEMIAVEALIRWPHPDRGLVQPDEFIHIAERIGLISELGEWVLRTACEQAISWQKTGVPSFRMAVNISGTHFEDGRIINSVKSLLAETGLDPTLLELEITEDVVQISEPSLDTFGQLKELGITIAIDDFGTGYSNLGSLKHLPIDCLKIDQVFIKDALTEKNDNVIIATVIAMGQALGLSVLAEGVETVEQVKYLCDIGCDSLQGFYFSKPVPADRIPELATTVFIQKS